VAKRALLIYNPAARGAPKLDRLRAAAGGVAGWEIAIELTSASGHATELARRAVRDGLEAVIACGGDGTVNEVANGLAGSTTALAVVRGGTANVWAKEIHAPKNPARALRLLAEGETRTIDLGRATWSASGGGERHFVCMAGVGFDAAIVRELAGGLKRRFGAASYIMAGFRRALRYRAVDAELVADNETLSCRLYWLTLGNTRNYGGVLNLAHMAKADDAKLELLVLGRGGVLRFAWLAVQVLLKRHHRRPDIVYRSVSSVDVRTAGLPVQIDGEYLGETPLRFAVAPGALRVIVPAGLKSPLFSS
jgi:YegS/Rv2252/BmrU family lipid kinase